MFFFHSRIVSEFRVSRLITGCFLFFLCISCGGKKSSTRKKTRIAKTVPANYVNANDPGFSKRQDTVYYGPHYFTGYQFSLYNDGDTAFINSYFNGVEEGIQKKWYARKQLAEERFYINGKKEGMQRGWWPDGKQKFAFATVGDEYEGEFKEWYSSGLLAKQFHYTNGREEGSQRLWWDNGTVRANYVIRKGKKYGLIGLVICKNPYDSISKK